MARVLLTTMQVSSATDDLLRPLIEAGHESAQAVSFQARAKSQKVATARMCGLF